MKKIFDIKNKSTFDCFQRHKLVVIDYTSLSVQCYETGFEFTPLLCL